VRPGDLLKVEDKSPADEVEFEYQGRPDGAIDFDDDDEPEDEDSEQDDSDESETDESGEEEESDDEAGQDNYGTGG